MDELFRQMKIDNESIDKFIAGFLKCAQNRYQRSSGFDACFCDQLDKKLQPFTFERVVS